MLSCEGLGKNIEKAIEDALFQLKAIRDDVDIKILDEGGLFKKAKVLVSISEDCVEKYEKRRSRIAETEDKVEEKNSEPEKEKKLTVDVKIEEKKAEKKADRIDGKDFIKGLLKELKIDAQVYVEETADSIKIFVEGGNSGDLIGYRGECMNAIQYVASIIQNECAGERKKLILDVEKYRQRREETLKALAHRMENKVEKTGKSVRLEPMNANERRIIHTELQSSETVTTTSKGIEPNRFIIVLPKREGQPEVAEDAE